MKQIDKMNLLRTSAGLLPVVALPVFAPFAQAQDTQEYKVVINHEEQYSIWFADRENPLGWTDIGKSGSQEDCQRYIREVWTDMRPLSLRKKMQQPTGKASYKVVINHEEQYSIWLASQELTETWRDSGERCSLKDCMSYIEEVWTDMRPLSLRKKQ